jgi:paraquat-inducible protein B
MSDTPPPHAIEHHSRWPGWIWAVPIAAVAIVGYLAFQQFAERGPEVTVTFPTGGGIKAGTAKVQFEGIEVGEVEAVRFEKDMRHVDAVLRLHRDQEGHLGRGTRFWIAGKPNSKYPPAKPGALWLAPLKAANGVADAAPEL